MSGQRQTLPPLAALKPGDQETETLGTQTQKKRETQLASLGSVVVSGCPPLASRICKRVSLNSRPGIEAAAAAAAAVVAGPGATAAGGAGGGAAAAPSRSAFSCAAFCARSRLSASICALIAAMAFLSFSFSKKWDE